MTNYNEAKEAIKGEIKSVLGNDVPDAVINDFLNDKEVEAHLIDCLDNQGYTVEELFEDEGFMEYLTTELEERGYEF